MEEAPHPLATPQTARATIRLGNWFVMESEARATPLGLLAVGGLVAAILLSVPPILRASMRPRRLPGDAPAPHKPEKSPTRLAK